MSIYVWLAAVGIVALSLFRFWPVTAPEIGSDFFATDHGTKPNYYQSSEEEGRFEVPSDQLETAFIAEMLELPRMKVLALNRSDSFSATYVQRSLIFGFPDIISVQITPRSETSAGITLFSQSKFGYSDFGVNRKRVKSLLAGLRQQFGT